MALEEVTSTLCDPWSSSSVEKCVVPGMQDSLAPFATSLWLFVLDVTSWGVSSQLLQSQGIMGQEGSMVHPTMAGGIYLGCERVG